jgi:hypothetical protein
LGTSAATSKKETTAQQKENESSRAKKAKEEVSVSQTPFFALKVRRVLARRLRASNKVI